MVGMLMKSHAVMSGAMPKEENWIKSRCSGSYIDCIFTATQRGILSIIYVPTKHGSLKLHL